MKDFIIAVLQRNIEVTEKESAKIKLADSIDWLNKTLGENSTETPLEVMEFLNRIKDSGVPVTQSDIDNYEGEVEDILAEIKKYYGQYSTAQQADNALGCERLKAQCNDLRYKLTLIQHEVNVDYRKLDKFIDKVYLLKTALKINQEDGIAMSAAKDVVKSYPEYIKFSEMKEKLMTIRDLIAKICKNLEDFHTDVRQTVTIIRKGMPDM